MNCMITHADLKGEIRGLYTDMNNLTSDEIAEELQRILSMVKYGYG
jgi:hypothetical protein